jgi:hypothetical protein
MFRAQEDRERRATRGRSMLDELKSRRRDSTNA